MKKPRMLHHGHHIMGASFEFEFLQPCGNKVSSRWWLSTSYTSLAKHSLHTGWSLPVFGECCNHAESFILPCDTCGPKQKGMKRKCGESISGHLMADDYMTCLWPCWRVTGKWECHPLSDYCWTLVDRSWDPTSPNIFFLVISDLPTSLRGERQP